MDRRTVARGALAACVALLIALQLVLRQDEAGWNARAHPHGVITLDGHLVEWEWFHVDEAVGLVDGEVPPTLPVHDQNVFRFVSAYLFALLREPLGSYYKATLVGEGIIWGAAAAAMYTLAKRACGSAAAGVGAAVLTAAGPGFVGYVGQVDAHPSGYAAAAIVPALLERLGFAAQSADRRARALRAVAGGLALCIAGFTFEVAFPLLLFVLAFYGGEALVSARQGRALTPTLLELGGLAVAFVLPYAGFRLLIDTLFQDVLRFNDPLSYLARHPEAIRSVGIVAWLERLLHSVAAIWLATFPAPVTALALAGAAAFARRRGRWVWWAATYGAAFGAAVVLTKPTPRELFLLYPAVYLLAAAGIDAIARSFAEIVRVRLSSYPARAAPVLVIGLLLGSALVATNVDLWGDYTLHFAWYTLDAA